MLSNIPNALKNFKHNLKNSQSLKTDFTCVSSTFIFLSNTGICSKSIKSLAVQKSSKKETTSTNQK